MRTNNYILNRQRYSSVAAKRSVGGFVTTCEIPDYDNFKYCNSCRQNKPKSLLHCDRCGHKLRTIPHGRKSKKWKDLADSKRY